MNDSIKKLVKLINLDEMRILPGHLAFNLIFIIIPILTFLSLIENIIPLNVVNEVLNKNIPNAFTKLVFDINNSTDNYNIFFFFIISFYLSSKGLEAIIITSNYLYKENDYNYFLVKIKSFLMFLILFLLILFIIIVPILGDSIMNLISMYIKDDLHIIINGLYHLLKYPFSFLMMFLFLKIIYTMSYSKIKSKYMNKGALFTTITWLILSRIYSYYLNNYNNYYLYFGNLANILVILVWVYLLSYLFVMGLIINVRSIK